MKYFWFFYFFFIGGCFCLSDFRCMQGFLKFGNETCFGNNGNIPPYADGRICKEIACTGYIKIIESHICIWPRKQDLKIMFYGEKDQQYDIQISLDKDDTYTVKQLAVSEKHISLLLISGASAYRIAFFINQLELWNDFKLLYLDPADSVVWLAFYDFDVYMKIIHGETLSTVIWPQNSGRNISSYNLLEQCAKWTDTQKNNFGTKILSSATPATPSVSWINEKTIFYGLLGILVSGISFIIVYSKFKKPQPTPTPNQTPQPNIIRVNTNEIPNNPPPPSYHTEDHERLGRLENDVANINRILTSQQTQTNASGSRETEERVPLLNTETNNSLVV